MLQALKKKVMSNDLHGNGDYKRALEAGGGFSGRGKHKEA